MFVFNRAIELASRPGEARAVVEDDFHHFRVAILHRDGRVTGTHSSSVRYPYTLCPAAGARLNELIGSEVSSDVTAPTRILNPRQQCTHQFDIAAIAIAAAARESPRRRYDASVEVRAGDDIEARLDCDGETVLRWTLKASIIESPPSHAGISVEKGFTDWAAATLPEEEREYVLVLRRTVFLGSNGARAAAVYEAATCAQPWGGCWVQQPERAHDARMVPGTLIRFAGCLPLSVPSQEWLSFSE